MMSVSALIDFLMNLMRDEDAKAEFDQDPQGTLTRNGLDGVSGQDVRDARLIMADDGGVRAKSGYASESGSRGDDPVREIHHTTTNYVINEGPTVGDIDQTITVIDIDDRDTTVIDSFNSADSTDVDVVAIQDNDQTNNIDVTDIDITDIDIEDSADEDSPDEDSADEDLATEGDPADGEPVGEEPVVSTDPVDGDPVEGAPTDVETADSTPIGDNLLDGEPVGSEPTGLDPADSGPVDVGPVDSGPVADEPDFETAVI